MRRFLELLRSITNSRARSTDDRRAQLRGGANPAASSKTPPAYQRGDSDRAEVIAALKRARWQPADTEGPEFGGLIEPHTAYRRGLMPEPFQASSEAEEPGPETSQDQSESDQGRRYAGHPSSKEQHSE